MLNRKAKATEMAVPPRTFNKHHIAQIFITECRVSAPKTDMKSIQENDCLFFFVCFVVFFFLLCFDIAKI